MRRDGSRLLCDGVDDNVDDCDNVAVLLLLLLLLLLPPPLQLAAADEPAPPLLFASSSIAFDSTRALNVADSRFFSLLKPLCGAADAAELIDFLSELKNGGESDIVCLFDSI